MTIVVTVPIVPLATNDPKGRVAMKFLEMRNMLMEQHGWNRRVATIATRLYLFIDTPESLQSAEVGAYGRPLLSEAEYRTICQNW